MKREVFLDKFVMMGGREISDLRYGLQWRFWRRLISKTRQIDYGCDFNKKGCMACREDKKGNRCCCQGCYPRVGFFAILSYHAIKTIAPLFDHRTGFWKAGIGCTLPAHIRSKTCVVYRCTTLDNRYKLELSEKYLLERIGEDHKIADHYERFKRFEKGRRNGILKRKGARERVFVLTDTEELFDKFLEYDFKMWKERKRWWKGQ